MLRNTHGFSDGYSASAGLTLSGIWLYKNTRKMKERLPKKKVFFSSSGKKYTFLFHMSKKIFLKRKTKKTHAILSSAEIHQWFPSTFSIPLTN